MVAATGRVVGKAWDQQLVAVDNHLLDSKILGQLYAFVKLVAWVGRRGGCQCNDTFGAEDIASCL